MKLNHLPRILHFLSKHGTEYHLYVLDKGIMAIIIAVQANLIRVNDMIIIPNSQFLMLVSPALAFSTIDY